jgi:DNA-binding response OmpR family regulator
MPDWTERPAHRRSLGIVRAFGAGVPGPSQIEGSTSFKSKRRILVADGDRAFRTTITAVLRANGYDVLDVANGFELLHVLQGGELDEGSHRFDLVICDARLSGKTGLYVFSLLGNASVPPVVFTTTTRDEILLHEAHRLGALMVMEKPVNVHELLTFIDGLEDRGSA